MKAVGILLLLLGLLAIGGGLLVAIASRVIPNEECELADRYRHEADELSKQAEASRGTPRQAELEKDALDKMQSARIWAEGCQTRRTGTTIAMIAGVITSGIGLVMAIGGFFLFKRARRAGV